jgi:hypothetical protein
MEYIALIKQCRSSKVCAVPYLDPVEWQKFVLVYEAVMAVHQVANTV